MGCTQSKIENEEIVNRCKDRRQFMKDAVTTWNAFAAAHSIYTVFLKNTGAALSDYVVGNGTSICLNPILNHDLSMSLATVILVHGFVELKLRRTSNCNCEERENEDSNDVWQQ
ncbi:hypothetical protein ACSBR2_018011 [Camellia fascicularis]